MPLTIPKIIPKPFFSFSFLLLSLFWVVNINANAYKCVDKTGKIIFQDSACADGKKETVIEIKKNLHANDSNPCKSRCDNKRTVCVTKLGNGRRNTGENLLLCEKSKEVCYLKCVNINQGEILDTFVSGERSSYERELRRDRSLRNKEKYRKKRKERTDRWDKRYNKWNCDWYKKKLAKLKAKWARKQSKGWKPKDEAYYLHRIENAKGTVAIECNR